MTYEERLDDLKKEREKLSQDRERIATNPMTADESDIHELDCKIEKIDESITLLEHP